MLYLWHKNKIMEMNHFSKTFLPHCDNVAKKARKATLYMCSAREKGLIHDSYQ